MLKTWNKASWLWRLGLLEGLTLIFVTNIAMPVKYLAHMPQLVKISGMLHGIVYLSYLALLFMIAAKNRWPARSWFMGIFLGFAPFGFLLLEDYVMPES